MQRDGGGAYNKNDYATVNYDDLKNAKLDEVYAEHHDARELFR